MGGIGQLIGAMLPGLGDEIASRINAEVAAGLNNQVWCVCVFCVCVYVCVCVCCLRPYPPVRPLPHLPPPTMPLI